MMADRWLETAVYQWTVDATVMTMIMMMKLRHQRHQTAL